MDKRKEANRRVKESITTTLFNLLKQKSISEITVSEIISGAGVARASFYRNYSSKENVITTLIADILENFRENIQFDDNDFYTYENVHKSFEYFSCYAAQVLDLHRFGYGSILLEMLNQFHEEVAGTMACNSIERYKLYMYIGSLYNTALIWLQNGQKENIDEITDMFYGNCAIYRKTAVLYVHGKGGNADEAEYYKNLFRECDIYGLDYQTFTPWETGIEIKEKIIDLKKTYKDVILIANSIGAFFSMNAGIEHDISRAFFISPIVNMERLIMDMMQWANVTEEELRIKKNIETSFGETLSWEYLEYVRKHPICWEVKTDILYGSTDNLTSIDTLLEFAAKHKAGITVMEGGEHWFHTDEQMKFLAEWIEKEYY
ncbi:MAG: TetR family transcriptional regulator [Lachnospiraceae bacterium]